MTKTKKSSARELPLVRRRIAALLEKTEANGCTPGEADAAIKKARELVRQYKLDPGAFRWPQTPSATETEPTSESKSSKPPRAAASGRGKGIGKLAERLIVENPDWSHAQIAEEVNRRIEESKATSKSVRWYASQMRKRGNRIPSRRKQKASA
ncbi:DUF2786 domain-containing protein [Methylocella sp.]|uniref:DUF2786 domain-containing protein n=1 Tax=Methylocella sp. TaxID=1978226 RepID=UPI0035AD9800